MYYLKFEGTPRRDSATAPNVAGAYISCWIDRPSRAEAIHAARSYIQSQGWIVDEPDGAHRVNEETYAGGKPGRKYFEQAVIDKEVFVFHTYPEVDEDRHIS